MLATVRRPFEAHLLNYKHVPHVASPSATPTISPRQSRSRSTSVASNTLSRRGFSFSTHRSTHSNVSNADVDTLDLNSTATSDGIAAPTPIRSLGTGVFTSHAHPPPVPAIYATVSHNPSFGMPPPFFQPSLSTPNLPLPPRMSALVSSSGLVPLSFPAQYAASNWRAVHPASSSPLAVAASRSQSHLPSTDPSQRFSYRVRYARSSVSLTRPHRLSTSTPADSVGWSSRSDSTSPRASHDGDERRATAGQIAYALLNGTEIPRTDGAKGEGNHTRHKSAPDASASAGAQLPRKGKLQSQISRGKMLVKSSSATLLGIHGTGVPPPAPKDTAPTPARPEIVIPLRKLDSERPLMGPPPSKLPPSPPVPPRPPPIAKLPAVASLPLASNVARQVHHLVPSATTKRLSADPSIVALLGPASWEKENLDGGFGFDFEAVKNKPLPRIMGVERKGQKAEMRGTVMQYR